MTTPRHPLRAALPFGAVALLAVTAASSAPRPVSLRVITDRAAVAATLAASGRVDSITPRPLGPTLAVSRETFVGGYLGGVEVRQLDDGRLLVNDRGGRRVLLFDSTLKDFTIVADSTAVTGARYGGPYGRLLASRGDTTLFLDSRSLTLLPIDPSGSIGPPITFPVRQDAILAAISPPYADPRGHIVYKAVLAGGYRPTGIDADGSIESEGSTVEVRMSVDSSGTLVVPPPAPDPEPDSAPVVRADLRTGQMDTLAYVAEPATTMVPFKTADGVSILRHVVNPVPLGDDWALMSDGSIAIVRAHERRLDWIGADGTRSSSGPSSLGGQRLSAAEKAAIVDSVRAFSEAHPSRWSTTDNSPSVSYVDSVVPAGELPDYLPRSALADADNHIWLFTVPGELGLWGQPAGIFDIVDRSGVLVDRVQVPAGDEIAGFAPGIVYLTSTQPNGLVLLRVRIR